MEKNFAYIKYTINELDSSATNGLDDLDWITISWCQNLNEDFIDKYSDKVFWIDICRYQKLTEPFIEKHSNKVDWDIITIFQKLSYDFLEKHLYKYSLCITHISYCKNSEEIFKLQQKYQHKYYIDKLEYELNKTQSDSYPF